MESKEIAMTIQEDELQLRVGDGDWRPLRVRQFDIAETMPGEEVPSWMRISEKKDFDQKILAADGADQEENGEEEHPNEEVDGMYAEGGKHAYVGEQPGEEEDDGENPEDVALDEDSMPDWIASLKGVHFFTLTQALVSPSAMHLRNLNAVYGTQGVRGARGKMLTMA